MRHMGGLQECFVACRTKGKSCALMLGDQQEPQWTTGVPPTLSIRELQAGSKGRFCIQLKSQEKGLFGII